ncbi:MAG: glycoside hydrolase family 2 protein, partial [Lachnospiraceae bacterium]|nr:glycoside hydrolase family 2 protein [Lachnospiraceae bacterium]
MALTEANYAGEPLMQVRLPHTCKETPLHYFDESIYQMVSGYRRIIKAPKNWKGKRVRLTFDGVAHACKVYLNGEEIGSHACGYTAFSVELTEHLKLGAENVLAVEVDSRESLNVPPFGYVIDYMTYGGIYRDAYLDVFEEAYLEDVFVSTVQMTGKRVRSRVKINAAKPLPEGESFVIRQSMKERAATEFVPICEKAITAIPDEEKKERRAARFGDDEGDGILYCATDADVSANEALGEIKLWELESPVLYVLKTELLLGDKVLDEREDTFGFRMAKFFRDGFYLNGKKVKLRGLNRHQNYPYVGYAAPKSLQVNDADILKHELGVNAVRTSHYPQSHYFLDRCDEQGLLVFTEFPGWQHIGDEAWKEQALTNLKDMILQYRNHPSIILWGVRINESVDDDEFYKKTNEMAHQLDPSRQTGGVRCIKKSRLFEDVYTYNDFVHEGNNKGCEPKKNVTPDMSKAYLISEFNGHMFPTKAYDCEDKRVEHALRHANVLEAVAEQEDIAGCFGWCMFDYNTHKDFGSGDRICYHGVMDMFRNPKLAAAVYASQQDEVPVLVPSSSMDIGEH